MKKNFPLFLVAVLLAGCAEDPGEKLLQQKRDELTGVWLWVNTQYPTPFGSIVVSPVKSGTLYKVVFMGDKAEVFLQNRLVQKFSFEVSHHSNGDFYLDILTKEEVERSSIDMLGGKITFDKKTLTLYYLSSIYESKMLLSRIEIF